MGETVNGQRICLTNTLPIDGFLIRVFVLFCRGSFDRNSVLFFSLPVCLCSVDCDVTQINGISRGGDEDIQRTRLHLNGADLIMTDGVTAVDGSVIRKDPETLDALSLRDIFADLYESKRCLLR